MKATVAALLVFLALASPQDRPPARGDRDERRGPERGVIAIVRTDGLMVPFAAFRRGTWSTPWPEELRNLQLPVNLDAVSNAWWGGWTPGGWHAWLTDGRDQALAPERPAMFRVHCNTRLGLRTDYRSPRLLPPVVADPFPKDGIATAGDLRVEPVEIVDRSSRDWGELAVTLLQEFDKAEELAVFAIRSASGWSHPDSREERRALPVRLESWYRTRADRDGSTLSYIEAVRSFPPRPGDEECGLETFFSGWVYQPSDAPRLRVQISARVMYCDRVGAMYMLPFGQIRVANRLHWIFQLSGWDEEWYLVTQLHSGRVQVVAEYFGGGRRSCG